MNVVHQVLRVRDLAMPWCPRSTIIFGVFAATACGNQDTSGERGTIYDSALGGFTANQYSAVGSGTSRGVNGAGTDGIKSEGMGGQSPLGGGSAIRAPLTGASEHLGGRTSVVSSAGGSTGRQNSVVEGGVTYVSHGAGANGIAGNAGASAHSPLPRHIIGADITISLEDEYWGATYTDSGVSKSIEQLLKDHGFNFIRLDTFVNPGASGGYADGMPEAFRDLEHTIKFAKRVKAIGLGLMLDLHYSDTWTNPKEQAPPAAWAALGMSDLENQVYSYTKDAISQLKAAGAMPDIVQIGNEITNGMLWNHGRISNSDFAGLATLIKAGIRGVHEVDSSIATLLHIEKCNNLATSKWWIDGVLKAGVSFDILGQSCYATAPNGVAGYQGTPADWQATFVALAASYPSLKFMIAEYSAEQRAAHETMAKVPGGRGLGAFNWDPTRAYSTHPNHPLFTNNGTWNHYVAIADLMALYEGIARDFGAK